MSSPDIDDYVQEAIESLTEILEKAMYHGDKIDSFVDLLYNRMLDLRHNIDTP